MSEVTGPSRLFLQINDACDSRCASCDFWLTGGKERLSLDFVASVVVPLVERGTIKFTCITGGEPTLHKELHQIVEKIKRAGSTVTLITSGSKLKECLSKITPYVDAYMLSFDGGDEKTYSSIRGVELFNVVCSLPGMIKSFAKATVSYSTVIQKKNCLQLLKIYDIAIESGVDSLLFRVPDLKPFSFGRTGKLRRPTSELVNLSAEDLQSVANSIEEIISKDQNRGLLGQTAEELRFKVNALKNLAANESFTDNSTFCDVPFTSLVIGPSESVRPCFYLAMRETVSEASNFSSLNVIQDTCRSILTSSEFRTQHCAGCHQFDGHKHSLKDSCYVAS